MMIRQKSIQRTCMEAVMTRFEVLSQQFPGGTEENHKKTSVKIAVLQAEV
jgi:hypothetical protein